jgi:hypothetical protein
MDVTVYPEPGMFPQIARRLLEAADHPGQVVSVSHPRAGFIVPQDVFKRFEASDPVADDPAPQPVKRRPGRPRKTETVPVKEE